MEKCAQILHATLYAGRFHCELEKGHKGLHRETSTDGATAISWRGDHGPLVFTSASLTNAECDDIIDGKLRA